MLLKGKNALYNNHKEQRRHRERKILKKYAMEMAGALGRYPLSRVMAEVLENSYYYDEGGEKYEYLAQLIKEENDLAETIWSVKSDDIILSEAFFRRKTRIIYV